LDAAGRCASLDVVGAMDGVTVHDQMQTPCSRNPAAVVLGQPIKVVPKRLDEVPSCFSFFKGSGVDLNHSAPTSGPLPDLLACAARLPRVCSRGPNEIDLVRERGPGQSAGKVGSRASLPPFQKVNEGVCCTYRTQRAMHEMRDALSDCDTRQSRKYPREYTSNQVLLPGHP
jgi:hypothetical protein